MNSNECPVCGAEDYHYESGWQDGEPIEPDEACCDKCGYHWSEHCKHPESIQVANFKIKKYEELQAENEHLIGVVESTRQDYDDLLDGSLEAKLQAENAQLKEDVLFLSRRAMRAESVTFTDENRDAGSSSNSIVSIAYGTLNLRAQILPYDESDLLACGRMWDKLPIHRKTQKAKKAMKRAKEALKG